MALPLNGLLVGAGWLAKAVQDGSFITVQVALCSYGKNSFLVGKKTGIKKPLGVRRQNEAATALWI